MEGLAGSGLLRFYLTAVSLLFFAWSVGRRSDLRELSERRDWRDRREGRDSPEPGCFGLLVASGSLLLIASGVERGDREGLK